VSKETNTINGINELSSKLDSIISLLLISNWSVIQDLKIELESDSISSEILKQAKGISYGEIVDSVVDKLGVSHMTVKRRLSELRIRGVITSRRVGREVFVSVTPVLE
jgi:DNA-binding transcriptional ArsR family regulator